MIRALLLISLLLFVVIKGTSCFLGCAFRSEPAARRLAETSSRHRTFVLSSTSSSSSSAEEKENPSSSKSIEIAMSSLDSLDSPVLQSVYPALVKNFETYGHANIPLGTREGRQCQTLRRLQVQQKLSAQDVATLDNLNFTWHSLEDVYRTADFDELFQRLVDYSTRHNGGDVSPPKKYPADPELGAWVTGIRRVGKQQLPADQVQRLEAIGFAWTSPRQCGSEFMKFYRNIQERIECNDKNVWTDPQVQKWVLAQQKAAQRQEGAGLSETRRHYMEHLLQSKDWIMEWKPPPPSSTAAANKS